MPKRTILKEKITMEDLAQGAGKVTQQRAGQQYSLGKVDLPYTVLSEEALKELDVTVFTKAKLDGLTYSYSPTDNSGIAPNVGVGSWLLSPSKASDVALSGGATLEEFSRGVQSGYRGEWTPETDVEAGGIYGYQGSEWRSLTGVSGVAPSDSDTFNWRKFVNPESVLLTEERLLGKGVSIYKGSNGNYAQNGDVIPVGTTHISLLINGKAEDFAAWDDLNLPATITSVPVSDNGSAGYDVVTDQGTFEFVTARIMSLRGGKDKSMFITPQGWGATGNDNVADTNGFMKAALYMQDIKGGKFYAPPLEGTSSSYLVDEDIIFGSNVTIVTDAWVKRNSLGTRQYDTMFTQLPGAENVRYQYVLLDCNNIPSISGLNFRRNNINVTAGTARIKNCTISNTLGGGRGLIIEDGVAGPEPKMCSVDTLVVEDSFNAFAFNGGEGSVPGDKNNFCSIVDKIIFRNVEVPVAVYGNNALYSHNGDEMSFIVNSITGKNGGLVTSSQPPGSTLASGIIGSIRGCNFQIKSGYIYNDPDYASGNNIDFYRGEYKNVDIDCVVDSELRYVIVDGATPLAFDLQITTTTGSPIITVEDSRKIEVGYALSGAGIPAGAEVLSVDSLTQITINQNATAAGAVTGSFSGKAVCRDSRFNVKVLRDISTDLMLSSSSASGHLLNNSYHFDINKILTNRMVPTNINQQTTNYLSIKSKEHSCFVFGKTGIGNISSGFLLSNFAGYMGQLGSVMMSDANGQPHQLTCDTAGKLRIDGTIVGTQS